MFEDSPLAAALGVLIGAVLLSVGTAVALNWRGWATRYTDWTDAAVPPPRRKWQVDRWPRMFVQNRIIFAVTAVFGALLIFGGIAALIG